MNRKNRFLTRISLILICSAFSIGSTTFAQDDVSYRGRTEDKERQERDAQKTKQAQAVSKEVYDQIQKAQELIDADNPQEALRILERLKTRKKKISDFSILCSKK